MSTRHVSRLLFQDDHPIMIQPSVAKAVGLNEAIVIQQLHYWIVGNKQRGVNFHEGRYWSYNTYVGWQKQLPFWSTRTVRRVMTKLEKDGYVLTGNFNKKGYDDTKWYTLDYAKLDELAATIMEESADLGQAPCPERTTPGGQSGHHPSDNLATPGGQLGHTNTRDYTETKPETKIGADSLRSSNSSEKEQTPKVKSQVSRPETPTRSLDKVSPDDLPDEEEGKEKSPDSNRGGKEFTALVRDSKYLSKQGTGQAKRIDMDELVTNTARKSKERRVEKATRPRKVTRNANSILAHFREKYSETLSGTPPLELGKDKALLKKMIEHYGYDEVVTFIDWMFRNWAKFRRECNLTGVPTVGMLFGYRGYLQEQTMHIEELPEKDDATEESDNPWGV